MQTPKPRNLGAHLVKTILTNTNYTTTETLFRPSHSNVEHCMQNRMIYRHTQCDTRYILQKMSMLLHSRYTKFTILKNTGTSNSSRYLLSPWQC